MGDQRIDDLRRFYAALDILAEKVGGPKTLVECSGRRFWPQRGVYFFMEESEIRRDSGSGARIVRVGTHALTDTSRTTLWKRLSQRRRTDHYRDFAMVPDEANEPMVFFGGKDYTPLFEELTRSVRTPRTLFYNSDVPPTAQGCSLVRFRTTTRTNWHYECARAFLRGDIEAA